MGNNRYGTYCVIGVIAAAVCLFVMKVDWIVRGMSLIFSAAAPLFLGCVIAYGLNILLKRLERLYFPHTNRASLIKSRRPACILLSFVGLFLILAFIVNLVVPELLSSIRLITDEIPPAMESMRDWAIAHSDEIPVFQDSLKRMNIDWQNVAKKTVDFLVAGAGGIFNSVVTVVSRAFGVAAKVLIGMIFAVYLLSAKERLCSQADKIMRAFLKPETRKKVRYVAETFHETFTSFIVGQCMEAVIIGCLCAVGMAAFRMPYAVMTGAVVGVTALIPVAGAYLGAAVGAFMVFTVNPITEVLKGLMWQKLPTKILAFLVAMTVTLLAFFAFCQIMGIRIAWYMIVGAVVLGIFVAYAAMYGFDKLKQTIEQINAIKK